MTKGIRKKNLLLSLAAILIFSFILRDRLLIGFISALTSLKNSLGEAYVRRLNFSLADDKEQRLPGGAKEKYVLKANDGSRWLFKVAYLKEDFSTLLACRMKDILGIRTPQMYRTWLCINGVGTPGYTIEMLPTGSKKLEIVNAYDYSPIIKNIIFGWILNLRYADIELMTDPSGKIYQIDLQNVFNNIENENVGALGEEYREMLCREEAEPINFKEAAFLIKYIEGINDKWLLAHLEKSFVKYATAAYIDNVTDMLVKRKNIGFSDLFAMDPEGNKKKIQEELNRYIDYILGFLIERKHSAKITFQYLFLPHKDFNYSRHAKNGGLVYGMQVCAGLIKDIINISGRLMSVRAQKNKEKISAISSGSAWEFIDDQFATPEASSGNAKFALVEAKLENLKRQSLDPREKIAIAIYLRQLRTARKFLNKFSPQEAIRFAQVVINAENLRDNSFLEMWLRDTRLFRKCGGIAEELSGEDEYINGLIKLIHNQNDEAERLLSIAQNKGYSVEEIDSLIGLCSSSGRIKGS